MSNAQTLPLALIPISQLMDFVQGAYQFSTLPGVVNSLTTWDCIFCTSFFFFFFFKKHEGSPPPSAI
jgi:hypothetical protein